MSNFLTNIWPFTPPAPSTQKRKRSRKSAIRSGEKRRRTLHSPSEYQNAAYFGSTLTLIKSAEDVDVPGTRDTPVRAPDSARKRAVASGPRPQTKGVGSSRLEAGTSEAQRAAVELRARARQLLDDAGKKKKKKKKKKEKEEENGPVAVEPYSSSIPSDAEESSTGPVSYNDDDDNANTHVNTNNSLSMGPPSPSLAALYNKYTPRTWPRLTPEQKWNLKPNLRAREVGSDIGIRAELGEPEYAFRDTEIRDGLWKVQDRMQRFAREFFADSVHDSDVGTNNNNEDSGDGVGLPASFYSQFSPETARVIDCVASGGPAGVRGWQEIFLNPQKRRTLVCAIIGNVLVEQVLGHCFFGGDEAQIGVLVALEERMRDEDGFKRTTASAHCIQRFLTHIDRDGSVSYILPPNFTDHVNTVVAALYTHLSPLITLSPSHPAPTLSALFAPLHILTTHAALLSLHMRLDAHTVYHLSPVYKEQPYTQSTMDCSNAQQMASQTSRSPRSAVLLTQITIMNGVVAYRRGGWEAPARRGSRLGRKGVLFEEDGFAERGFREKIVLPAWVFCRRGSRACSETVGVSEEEAAERVHGGFVGFTSVEGVVEWRGGGEGVDVKGKGKEADVEEEQAEIIQGSPDFDLSGAGALESGERGLFEVVKEGKRKAKTKTKAKAKTPTKAKHRKNKAATPSGSDPDR